jgi:hypothetical protein
MDENLRFEPGRKEPSSNHSRFSDSMGILRAAEKCNGSGDAGNRPQLVEVCVQVIERR